MPVDSFSIAHRTLDFIFFASCTRRLPARTLTSHNLPACSSHSHSLLYSTATQFPHVFRHCSNQSTFVLFVLDSSYIPPAISRFVRRLVIHPLAIFHFVWRSFVLFVDSSCVVHPTNAEGTTKNQIEKTKLDRGAGGIGT